MSKDISLKKRTILGVFWNFVERFLRRGISGGVTLVLAWFLVPSDFGLIAMMAVFLAFSNVIVDGGFKQALIRKKSVSQIEYNTAFYSNIILALIIYVVLFICAPVIATFYDEPRLIELIRFAGLAVFPRSLSVVQEAVLTRQLKFKLQMKVSLPASLISGGVAIGMAMAGFGVWALVWQILVSSILLSLFYWCLGLWFPSLKVSWMAFMELFQFGGYIFLSQATYIPFKHMYVIVIAKGFASSTAGLYFFAEKIKDIVVNQFISSIQTVTYPALANRQDEPDKLKQGYRQVIALTSFLLLPVLIFLAALIEIIFRLLFPEVWFSAAYYFQLMCFSALMYPLHAVNLNILKVMGRSDLVFYIGLFKKALAIGILLLSYPFGIVGILVGQMISSILSYLPNCFFSKQLIGYSVKEQLVDFIPSLLVAGTVGIGLFYAERLLVWNDLSKLIVLGGGAIVAYLVISYSVRISALELAIDLIRNRSGGNTRK